MCMTYNTVRARALTTRIHITIAESVEKFFAHTAQFRFYVCNCAVGHNFIGVGSTLVSWNIIDCLPAQNMTVDISAS